MKNIDTNAALIRKALAFAEKKHRGQTRKLSGSPYIHHPIIVSYLAAYYKKSKNIHLLIVAAILHDVIEDTDATPEEIVKHFGQMVSSLVFELTDNKEEIARVGKVQYQKKKWTGISKYALLLKLCDRLANVSDLPADKYKTDTLEVLEYLQKNRKLTSSQKEIVQAIKDVLSNRD